MNQAAANSPSVEDHQPLPVNNPPRAEASGFSWVIIAIAIEMILAFIWVLNCNQVESNDTWWHLELGRWMVDHGEIISKDIYSQILHGKEYIPYEWLSQVLFFAVADPFGNNLTYLKLAIMILGSLVCGSLILRGRWTSAATLPAVMFLCYLMAFRAQIRPQLFGMWCLAGTMTCLTLWRRNQDHKPLWPLIAIFALWANFHGSYLLGVVVLVVVTVLLWLQHSLTLLASYDNETVSRKNLQIFTGIVGAAVVATLFNPYHYHLWIKSLGVFVESRFLRENIREWVGIFHVRRGEYWVVVWAIYIACSWMCIYINQKGRSLIDFVLLAMATLLPFLGIRHVTSSAIIAFPILIRHSNELWPRVTPRQAIASLSLLVMTLTYTAINGNTYSATEHKEIGVGFKYEDLPMDIIEHINSKGLKGAMMNHYLDGAYIMYYVFPMVKACMDSRTDLYGEILYKEHQDAYKSPQAFFEYTEKYKLNLAMLKLEPRYQELRAALISHPDWQLEKVGHNRVLFSKVDQIIGENAKSFTTIKDDQIEFSANAATKSNLPRQVPLAQVSKLMGANAPTLPTLKAIAEPQAVAGAKETVAKPDNSAAPSAEYCAIVQALGHCAIAKGCEKSCKMNYKELAGTLHVSKDWCPKFVRTCHSKQTACGPCRDLCLIYGRVIGDLNKNLHFAYPPVHNCQ